MKSKVMINLKTKNYVKPILFIVSILTLAGCRQISVSNINNDYVIDQDSGTAVDIKQILDLKGKFDNGEAGETITIPAGIYEGNFVLRNSGTRENPIRITAKSGETVTLALPSNGAGAILELDHVHDICISGLNFGPASGEDIQGILVTAGCYNIEIYDCTFSGLETTLPDDPEQGGANALLLFGDGDTEESAIHDVSISGNQIFDNTTGWSEAVSITGNVSDISVTNNVLRDNTNIGIDFSGNYGYCPVAALDQPRNCIAKGNKIERSVCSYAECAGLYVDGARDIQLLDNEISECMIGIEVGAEQKAPEYPAQNILVRGNTMRNNPYGGLWVGGYSDDAGFVTDVIVTRNTFQKNGTVEDGFYGEIYQTNVTNLKLSDNTFQ